MPVTDIHQLHKYFAEEFNAGNLEALLDLYEVEAVLVPQPGKTATGREAISQALNAFMGMGGRLNLDTSSILVSGNVALLRGTYQVKSGEQVLLAGSTIEVARRHSDGNWYYVIDNPFPG